MAYRTANALQSEQRVAIRTLLDLKTLQTLVKSVDLSQDHQAQLMLLLLLLMPHIHLEQQIGHHIHSPTGLIKEISAHLQMRNSKNLHDFHDL